MAHDSKRSDLDDNKRTEVIACKVTERMALDLARLANSRERSVSDFCYCCLRTHLYGGMIKLEDAARKSQGKT